MRERDFGSALGDRLRELVKRFCGPPHYLNGRDLMDHAEAVRLQAAVKYVLGELPPVERDSFEEHYFDCGECALDVHAAAAFADNARNVLCHEAREGNLRAAAPARGGSFAWLRPVVAVPALAVLLMALAYQSLVSVPYWKMVATQSAAPRVLPMFSLIAANTRGAEGMIFHVQRGERFGLYVDVPVDASYRTYVLRIEDPAGNSTILRSLSYEEAQKTQVVEVNPGSRSGVYQLKVLGLANKENEPGKETLLANMKFVVEFTR